MPEIPVTPDFNVWKKYQSLFERLYTHGFLTLNEIHSDFIKECDIYLYFSQGQYRFSTAGLLLHEALKLRGTDSFESMCPKSGG